MTKEKLEVGDEVKFYTKEGFAKHGNILAINEDGTYKVNCRFTGPFSPIPEKDIVLLKKYGRS